MTDFKKEAEKVAEKIAYDWNRFPGCTMHKNDIKPDIAAALERVAKESEIRGLEACKELCGVDMDLPIGSFVQEFEIDAEIARRRGETNG